MGRNHENGLTYSDKINAFRGKKEYSFVSKRVTTENVVEIFLKSY